MCFLKKSFLVVLSMALACLAYGQLDKKIDSLKNDISKAKTAKDKIASMDVLSRVLMSINLQEADEYGRQLILIAEESRDRKLMIEAYLSNGLRCGYIAGRKDYTEKAIGFYNQALEIAKKNGYQDKIGTAQLRLSATYLAALDKDNALKFVSQGFSILMNLDNDSLKAEAYKAYGNVYLARNEKKLALQNYLNALRIAEDAENNPMIRDCYLSLSAFYSNIDDYDKALDYYTLALKKLDVIKEGNIPMQRTVYMTAIGNLYAEKKSFDIAIGYFNRSIAMADSLKFANLKIPGYFGLLNQYLRKDEPRKALDYINSAAGENLKNFLTKFGFSGIIDQAYAVIYTELNQFDSAKAFFNKAAPFFEHATNENNKINFYAQWATLYEKTGENNKAIEYYKKVEEMARQNGLLESIKAAAKHLDSLYAKSGNYRLSNQYNSMYYLYKDSSEKINKEKELAQVEAADVQQRLEKEEKKKEEAIRRNHNIQYMAITIGIALLFVVLVVMGIFKVSENMIRVLGFFAFIMFFEFIILIADNKIHDLTHGEPWKVLAIKIILIAMLLPLHHWLEHSMIKYLTSHNRLTAAGHHIRKIFNRDKPAGL